MILLTIIPKQKTCYEVNLSIHGIHLITQLLICKVNFINFIITFFVTLHHTASEANEAKLIECSKMSIFKIRYSRESAYRYHGPAGAEPRLCGTGLSPEGEQTELNHRGVPPFRC